MLQTLSSERDAFGVPVVPLYKLALKGTDVIHDVVCWDGYGPVAPRLWTTNGSIGYVAKYTAEYVQAGLWEVVEPQVEADFSDAGSIMAALRLVCRPSLTGV